MKKSMRLLGKNMILFFLLIYSMAVFSQEKNKKNNKIAKLFKYHLGILDSASNKYEGDTIPCCGSSIAFMVEHSDVIIHAEGTFHGFLFFTRSELIEWHIWYKKSISLN